MLEACAMAAILLAGLIVAGRPGRVSQMRVPGGTVRRPGVGVLLLTREILERRELASRRVDRFGKGARSWMDSFATNCYRNS